MPEHWRLSYRRGLSGEAQVFYVAVFQVLFLAGGRVSLEVLLDACEEQPIAAWPGGAKKKQPGNAKGILQETFRGFSISVFRYFLPQIPFPPDSYKHFSSRLVLKLLEYVFCTEKAK